MNHYLKWWLLLILVIIGSIISQILGGFYIVWQEDYTKISFIIMGVYLYMTYLTGRSTYLISTILKLKIKNIDTDDIVNKQITPIEELGWFLSEVCLGLGMIGTVVGFIGMLYGFSKVNVGDVSSIQALLKGMSEGMATALFTTLVGLICGTLIKMQCFNINEATKQYGLIK